MDRTGDCAVEADRLVELDHAHLWHPFTPMAHWRGVEPLIIERGEGPWLYDTAGRRYLDGVSSLWCNVHGHRVPAIDNAIAAQLKKVAHTTLLGLASPPSIELAGRLVELVNRRGEPSLEPHAARLNKVFYSDAGATAVEAALKMAAGYWCHRGRPQKNSFIAMAGAYHGDTTGAMSAGFSELFHHPFASMVFDVVTFATPDACHQPCSNSSPKGKAWPSEDMALNVALMDHCLRDLERLLQQHADDTAAIIIEPVMQGAAGMICQPPGFVRGVAKLARQYDVLLIADEVATGFGRTGKMFACEHELGDDDRGGADIMCIGKGLSGGYLPLAATLTTDDIEQSFCGESPENRTFFHGHTYTGNALACAAALASLDLFEQTNLLDHINRSAAVITDRLGALRDSRHVLDLRQRGIMVGIELCRDRQTAEPLDPSKRSGAAICAAMRRRGLIIRPLGDVVVLMPIPAMAHDVLVDMLDIVVDTIMDWQFD